MDRIVWTFREKDRGHEITVIGTSSAVRVYDLCLTQNQGRSWILKHQNWRGFMPLSEFGQSWEWQARLLDSDPIIEIDPAPGPVNRREHERFRAIVPVKITHQGNELLAMTQDISAGGACLRLSSETLEINDTLTLTIRMPRTNDEVEVVAKVVDYNFSSVRLNFMTQMAPTGEDRSKSELFLGKLFKLAKLAPVLRVPSSKSRAA